MKVAEEVMEIVKTVDFKNKLKQNILFVESVLNRDLQKRKFIEVYGWDKDVVEDMYSDYIRFLALIKTLKEFRINIPIVPNRYIDDFWHKHILDTYQYAMDCEEIFGEYLHHFPYFGMRNDEDREEWFKTAELAQSIWKECFGENLYGDLSKSADSYEIDKEFYGKLSKFYKEKKEKWAMGCSRCRTCRPSNCP